MCLAFLSSFQIQVESSGAVATPQNWGISSVMVLVLNVNRICASARDLPYFPWDRWTKVCVPHICCTSSVSSDLLTEMHEFKLIAETLTLCVPLSSLSPHPSPRRTQPLSNWSRGTARKISSGNCFCTLEVFSVIFQNGLPTSPQKTSDSANVDPVNSKGSVKKNVREDNASRK